MDGLVQVDNLGMRVGKGSEKLKYVLGVDLQFHGMVWEGAWDRGEGGIPGNGPVAMGLDMFQGLTSTDGEIKVPN